jgi:hypothetical protein
VKLQAIITAEELKKTIQLSLSLASLSIRESERANRIEYIDYPILYYIVI